MHSHVLRPSLASITSVSAATVGLLMGVGGAALMFAVVSTEQPAMQVVTACVLLIAGTINMHSSVGIRRQQPRAVFRSAFATVVLLGYLGVLFRDFGEIFWLNVALLLLLVFTGRGVWLRSSLVT